MDFGLFAHSGAPSFAASPSVSPSASPTPIGHAFDLSFLESAFLWWCVKLFFGYAVVRDLCFYGIPRMGGMIKTAIEATFTSPFASADETGEFAATMPAEAGDNLERTRSEGGDTLQRLKPRIKGGAYHYSSALEVALGMKEGDVEKGLRKGIDALGDKAEEVVERMAEGALATLLGSGQKSE